MVLVRLIDTLLLSDYDANKTFSTNVGLYVKQKMKNTNPQLEELKPKENNVIWKYLSFNNFLRLIEKKELYFPNCDVNKGYYEGYFSPLDKEYLIEVFKKDNFPEPKKSAEEVFENFNEYKKFTFIDCWHIKKDENFAMWRIFGINQYGICIKSTTDKLETIYSKYVDKYGLNLYKIKYFNKNEDINSFFNTKYTYLRKPYYFENEAELRGIIQFSKQYPSWEKEKLPTSVKIQIDDFNSFIDNIIINPNASEEFFNLVKHYISEKKELLDADKIVKSQYHQS